MLMILTPCVNLTNILLAVFTPADPISIKKIDNLPVYFVLLKSLGIKAARRTLMKFTPELVHATPLNHALVPPMKLNPATVKLLAPLV